MLIINKGVTVRESDTVQYVADMMSNSSQKYAVVISEKGNVKGVSSYQELVQYYGDDKQNMPVKDVMRHSFTVINNGEEMSSIYALSSEKIDFPIVVVGDDGKLKGIITEKELIEFLVADNNLIHRILDNLEDGVLAIDDKNIITYVNNSWKAIHNVENESLIGENIMEKMPESGILEQGNFEAHVEPLHINFSDVTVMPMYKHIVNDEDENVGSMAIVRDFNKVSEFNCEICRYGQINTVFSSIFDSISEMVCCVDLKCKVVYTNKKFDEVFKIRVGHRLKNSELMDLLREAFLNPCEQLDTKEISIEYDGSDRLMEVDVLLIKESERVAGGAIVILKDITEYKKMRKELKDNRKLLEFYKDRERNLPDEIVCKSKEYKLSISIALKVAETDAPVLIEGENGVGKEVVANLIHNNSSRKNKPFIPVNCGAIPETLWESEMFGYEEGSFTGAKKGGKIGIFEMADGGTVFLDEIGEMSLASQVKLLRFLQNMEIEKVGRKAVKKVDVRVIAATNKDLKMLTDEGEFRDDLYYRLNVVNIKIPPLRERISDIRPMAEKFLADFNKTYGKNISLTKGAISLLERNKLQGNVRQLRNVIEQAVIMCDDTIEPYDLALENKADYALGGNEIQRTLENNRFDIQANVSELEKRLISNAIEECNGNKSKAINLLNISRKTFYKKLKDFEIEV